MVMVASNVKFTLAKSVHDHGKAEQVHIGQVMCMMAMSSSCWPSQVHALCQEVMYVMTMSSSHWPAKSRT